MKPVEIEDPDIRAAAEQITARIRAIAPELTAEHAAQITAEFIEASLEARHLERLDNAVD
jgi:hypothetical protein